MNFFKKLFSRKTNNENIIPEEINNVSNIPEDVSRLPNINITSTDSYIKMEIHEDCAFKEYCSELDKLSCEGIDEINQLPMRLLISKGIEIICGQTIYLINTNGFSYTISVNSNNVYISSRKTESEEVKEATIKLDLQSKRYKIANYVHDLNRSTKSVKTYAPDEVGNQFSMTTEEAKTTVDLMIKQLEQIDFIDEILDLNHLKECLTLSKSQKFQRVITIDAHKEKNIVDSTKMKSRAIIVNNEGKILIANYGGVYLFPGGSIDEGESPDDAIIRELKEEAGLEVKYLEAFAKVKYFQNNYPTREGKTINRLLITYYYIGNEEDAVKYERELTEKEMKDGFELKYYSVEEIETLLEQNKTTNPRNEYFNREIKTIIQYYKKEKIRKFIER